MLRLEAMGSTVAQCGSGWGVDIGRAKGSKKDTRTGLVIYVLTVKLWLGTAIAAARGVK